MPEFAGRQHQNRNARLVGPAKPDRAAPRPVHAANPILSQQQVLGNQAMQRFAQSCPLSLPSRSVCPFGGTCHTCPARVQTKLTINKPGDKYEQEADRVAEQVMRMSEQEVPVSEQIHPLHIQRQCLTCDEELQRQPLEEEEEEEEELVQAKEASGQTPEVTPNVQAKIDAMRGGGQPLPKSVRAFFEARFGYDFGQVRMHTDTPAAETARAVNARAFTVGQDIFFGLSEYRPGSAEAPQSLAHELTHVMQQNDLRLAPAGNGAVGPPTGLARAIVQQCESVPMVQRQTEAVNPRIYRSGALLCCSSCDCPSMRRGPARPGDRSAQNGINLSWQIVRHRRGNQYFFRQQKEVRQCMQFSRGDWEPTGLSCSPLSTCQDDPGTYAVCATPNAQSQIMMADCPGFDGSLFALGSAVHPDVRDVRQITQRANFRSWVEMEPLHGPRRRIGPWINWHSVSRIVNVMGHWSVIFGGNEIGPVHIHIGGCPPPR